MISIVPGILETYFGIAVALTIPVSLLLLAWYRRDVAKEMQRQSSEASSAESFRETRSDRSAGVVGVSALRLRVGAVYCVAVIAGSAVGAYIWFNLPKAAEFSPFRAFVVTFGFGWVLTPVLAVMLALSRRAALLLLISYVVAGAVMILTWSVISMLLGKEGIEPLGNLKAYAVFLAITAAAPAVAMLLTGFRKIRPVAPLTFTGLLTFSFGALLTFNLFTELVDSSKETRDLLMSVPHARFVFYMIASVPVGYVCWLLLRGLSSFYRSRAFSDAQLVADSWQLTMVFWLCADFSLHLGWWGLVGLLGFVAYRTTVALGLALWPIGAAAHQANNLLLLRVFGFQSRTEKLFDAVAQPWRFKGHVNLIAGSDLAGRIVDPGDIVAFVGGGLQDSFVRDAEGLARRIGEADAPRDPDGRFRLAKFFCHANSWQRTVRALMAKSDVVLMDLRGFNEKNDGCLYELQQLAGERKLSRTLFVVDKDTDVDLLRSTLQTAWAKAGFDGAAPLNVAQLDSQSGRDLRGISSKLDWLVAAA